MARTVPIVITVSGGQQGAAEVDRLGRSFNALDTASTRASTGGLRNTFNATGLMRSEIQSLASQIPIVGRFFNGLTSDALNYAKAAQQVTQQMKLQKSAYDEFIKLVANQSQSKSPLGGGIIPILGDLRVNANTLTSETNRRAAFSQYLKEFQAIEDPAKRAQIAIDQFGAKGAQLLPILESMSAAEVETATTTAAVGSSFLAVAAPIAIALAAVVAIAAGFALAVKAGVELVNLATTQASKFQDLSDKTNFQVETLQGLNVGAIKAGGNIEKLSAGLGIFDKNITQAYESDTKLAKQFKDFNIDVSNNEVALRQVLAALAAMPPGAKQTELAMLAFGKSGKDVVGVLKNLDGTLDEQIEKLKQMGFIMSKEDVKAAADFGDKIDLLKLKIIAMGARIGLELIPYADKLITKFDELANRAGPHVKEWADTTIEHFKNVAVAVRDLSNVALTVATAGAASQVENDDGAWLLGKLLKWGTGAGVIISTLDKIGAAIRGVQQAAAKPPEVGIEASLSSMTGKYTSQQQDVIDNAVKAHGRLRDSLQRELDELNDPGKLGQVNAQLKDINKDTLDLAPAYKDLTPIIQNKTAAVDAESRSLAQQIQTLKEQQQASKDAASARDVLNNKITEANLRAGELTETGSKALTHVQEFNNWLAKQGDAYKKQKDLIDQATVSLGKWDAAEQHLAQSKAAEKAAAAQQRLAESLQSIIDKSEQLKAAALPEKEQQLAESHAGMLSVLKDITKLSDGRFTADSYEKFVVALKGAKDLDLSAVAESLRALIGPEQLANIEKAGYSVNQLAAALIRANQADHDRASQATISGQLTREYNALLDEQKDLNDPIIQQQVLKNNLLRDAIDLQHRDIDAVSALGRAELELADKATYHAAQANAQVAEFMARTASVTEIVADAKTGVIQTTFDYLDAGLQKANSHLGRMGGLLTQIEGDFIKLAATKFFQWLFGIGGGTSSGGGGGGFLGGIFGGGGPGGTPTFAGGAATVGGGASSGQSLSRQFLNFIRGGGGGTAQYASTAPFLGSLSALTNEGISVPQSLSGANPFLSLRGGGTAVDTNLLSAIGGGGGAKPGLGASLLQFAPLLGLGVGAAAGSRFGIGGQIGGGAIGLGAALGIGNLFGSTALSTVAATLGISMTAVTAGLFGIGAAVLVASILIKKNAEKRKNETARAALNNDTYTAIIQILNNARSGQYSSAGGALADFDKVKSDYFSKISGYDSKTKKIATDVWNDTKNGFEYYRPLIKLAAEAADVAKTRSSKLVPEFRDAGAVWPQIQAMQHLRFADSGFIGRVPGLYDRQDDKLIRVSGDEVVLAPKHWKPITKYLQAVRVPGFADSGAVSRSTAAPPVTDGGGDIVFHASSDAHTALLEAVLEGMTSPDGRKIIIKTSAGARRTGQL
jgi:hypothetical protein